jgi:N-acetylmuramoyl-L-alanine amidase
MAASGQRVVEYEVLEQAEPVVPADDYEILLRIVEAEAGTEDEKGRMLVAGVVLNRVASDKFPDTIEGVVFQEQNGTCQFSPVANGRYYSVTVSDETISAVDKVLAGEDVTEGALYFASRQYATPEKMEWFDNHLTPLFSYGGHEFFN